MYQSKDWINDSFMSKLLCRFRACDVGLGNRAPLSDGKQYKLCKLCQDQGKGTFMNNEVHMLIQCSSLAETRSKCGILDYMKLHRSRGASKSDVKLARMYLGDDGSDDKELLGRAKSLESMLRAWETLMRVPSNTPQR